MHRHSLSRLWKSYSYKKNNRLLQGKVFEVHWLNIDICARLFFIKQQLEALFMLLKQAGQSLLYAIICQPYL